LKQARFSDAKVSVNAFKSKKDLQIQQIILQFISKMPFYKIVAIFLQQL
jgi:hypothetical protein